MTEWMEQVVFWHWWILAGILLILELTIPAFFFLWLGIAAAATGLIVMVMPGLSMETQLVLFAVLCFVWRGDPVRRARRLQAFTAGAYRLKYRWLRWLGIVNFEVVRPLPGLPDGPCVVIANHPTLMDITAITATLGGKLNGYCCPGTFHQIFAIASSAGASACTCVLQISALPQKGFTCGGG